MKTQNIKVKLQVAFLKEGDSIIAYSPALDLSAYGTTKNEAQNAFETSFIIFIEETLQSGTLLGELLRLGWELKLQKFTPPKLSENDIKQKISSSHFFKELKEPKITTTSIKEVCMPSFA
ncbi:MAG: hypothetical protein ACRDFC_09205 [Ignavibacteria bacterium]